MKTGPIAETPRPKPDLRLIVITDADMARPRSLEDVVAAAVHAGAPAIQLRMKGAPAAELYHSARSILPLTRAAGAVLFVNDRLDVALAADADGVHLGPADLPLEAARRAAHAADRPDLLIGVSTDDPDAARRAARHGADYIGCGAVFGTTSKAEARGERIGTDRLAQVVAAVDIPVVGIGGITPDNAVQVFDAGAAGIAVIGAVMGATDVADAVSRLLGKDRTTGPRKA